MSAADGTTNESGALACNLQATNFVLAERERELLELKGPCSACRLHYAHAGPCDIAPAPVAVEAQR